MFRMRFTSEFSRLDVTDIFRLASKSR